MNKNLKLLIISVFLGNFNLAIYAQDHSSGPKCTEIISMELSNLGFGTFQLPKTDKTISTSALDDFYIFGEYSKTRLYAYTAKGDETIYKYQVYADEINSSPEDKAKIGNSDAIEVTLNDDCNVQRFTSMKKGSKSEHNILFSITKSFCSGLTTEFEQSLKDEIKKAKVNNTSVDHEGLNKKLEITNSSVANKSVNTIEQLLTTCHDSKYRLLSKPLEEIKENKKNLYYNSKKKVVPVR